MSGAGQYICLSNLPGRNNAESRISIRLVAANTITFVDPVLKPSISTRSWLSVFSASD